ncbi:MAG TPA: polysaccharide biosynthesis C-terminal domain-containing protein [Actinomycetota bacterium]|nr:polysaccharide biosynthesis C-terminal domain-containing protein [Actinomycetota bacterium]
MSGPEEVPVGGPDTGRRGDYLTILSGTGQNVLGIFVAALATFAAQILISNTLGSEAFGVVTVVTMGAFVLSFLTRAGTDMAVLRDVAIEVGVGRTERIRAPVARAGAIAFGISLLFAIAMFVGADAVRALFRIQGVAGRGIVEAAAVGLPFIALANVWLSATRGLKIMRYTLYVFWAGQPVAWIVLMVLGWQLARTSWMAVLAYSVSWVVAAAASYYFWRKESRRWDVAPYEPGDLARLFRYAGPRAPAALFSQLLFWTDLFVLTRYAAGPEIGFYSAALRAGQILVLFLTSVSLMFSPYVADMHARGLRVELDRLFKRLTRWTLAATLPVFLLLAIAPDPVLRLFGSAFEQGETALLILIAGQFINVATGSVGFVLIMVGRTGWDLTVYAASLVVNLGLAFWLCPRYGMEGAAVANATTFALSKWARLALVRRFVGIQPYEADYARLLVPASIAAIVMWAATSLVQGRWFADLVVTATAGAVAYVISYLVAGLTPDERRAVSALGNRVRTR